MRGVVGAARGGAALGALVALALVAGCELRADVRVDVDRDGAGTFEIFLAVDDELDALAADAGIDPLGEVAAAVDDAGVRGAGEVRWEVVEEAPVDERWARAVTVRAESEDPGALREEVVELTDGLAAAELDPLADVAVEVTEDTVAAEVHAGLEPLRAVQELGLTVDEAEALLGEHVDYTVEVRLPAEVTSAPGTRVDGRRAQWDVPAGAAVEAAAVSPRPPAWPLPWPLPWQAWALVAAVAAVAAALGWWLARRRTRARPRARPRSRVPRRPG